MSSRLRFNRLKRGGLMMMLAALSLALLAGLFQPGRAQQPATNTVAASVPAQTAAAPQPAVVTATDDRYRIGPGDVLDIRVFNKPQFSRDGVRVDGRGMIRMPLVEGEIQAACRTEHELATELTTLLKEYLRQPQVDVFIKDYQSQPVAVLGAVRAPSRFQLQRRVRLLELLSYVGGPSDNAGRAIQIVHTAAPSVCEAGVLTKTDESSISVLDNFKLTETLRGDEQANPFVRPGDVISIAEAEQAYVVGNVLRPSIISLRERVTVSRAIAMSGGLMPDTKTERVRIVRQAPDSVSKTELFVDLKAIDKRKAEDVVLQAGDIVDVPTAGGKRLLRSLIGAVVPAVGQLPVRVIP
ncbi:MAG TPA: polysaccharide biosynthesis/export family protein [Pyrinomonadaceae bacterium]